MKIAISCPSCDGIQLSKSPAVLMPFVAKRVFGWDTIYTEGVTAYSICNTVRCLTCGMVFCDIRFDDDELARLYAGYWDEKYTAMRKQYEHGYGERVWKREGDIDYIPAIEWFLAPHLKFPVDVLDWGGDTGSNTPFKDKSGIVHIYEIGDNPVVWGERVATPHPPYDLIVCGNVLEHAPYPADVLTQIGRVMGDALLYIEIPYYAGTFTSKAFWHEHINFFTETAIDRLLGRCGMEIVAARHLPPYYQIACKKI